jgi:hypothetical protein
MTMRSLAQPIRIRRYADSALTEKQPAHRAYAAVRSLYAEIPPSNITPSGNAAPAFRPGAVVPLSDGATDTPESSTLRHSAPTGQEGRRLAPPLPGPDGAGARWILNPTRRRNRLTDAGFRGRVSVLCLSPGRPPRRPEAGGDEMPSTEKKTGIAALPAGNFYGRGVLGPGSGRRICHGLA